jgi:threonine dehydratase
VGEDDIAYFEYTKKHNRYKGPTMVGIKLESPSDFKLLLARIKEKGFLGEYLNDNPALFQFLV